MWWYKGEEDRGRGQDLVRSQIESATLHAHANRLHVFVGGRVVGDRLRMRAQMTTGADLE